MSRYRTISVKMWGDDRFSRLSKPQPNAQTLWIYLLTGPHTTAFPGVFVAGQAGLAEALGWPLKAFKKAFAELLGEDLIQWDAITRLLFIPKAIRHNPPQSPNVVISWRHIFNDLPDCQLKQTIFETSCTELSAIGKGEAYREAFGKPFVMPMPNHEPEPDPEQEQDQEHEHEQKLAFGQFANVLLTESEKGKLEQAFGGSGASIRIEQLSEAIASKGYKYKSHYATILTWDRKNGGNGNGNGTGHELLQRPTGSLSELTRDDARAEDRRREAERVRLTLERSRGTES